MKQASREYNVVDYGHDRKEVLLKLKHGIFFGNYQHSPEYLGQLSLSPTDTHAPLVYSRAKDHKLIIVDYDNTKKRKVLQRLIGHEAQVTVVKALSREFIISADASGTLILWNLPQNQLIVKRQNAHIETIKDIQIIDNKNFVTAGQDKRLKFWNFDKLVKENDYTELLVTEKAVETVCILNEKEFLFVERHDNPVETDGFIDFRVFKIHSEVRVQELIKQYIINKNACYENFSTIQLLPTAKLIIMSTSPTGGHVKTEFPGPSHLFSSKKHNLLLSGRVITWEKFEKEAKLVVFELPYVTHHSNI